MAMLSSEHDIFDGLQLCVYGSHADKLHIARKLRKILVPQIAACYHIICQYKQSVCQLKMILPSEHYNVGQSEHAQQPQHNGGHRHSSFLFAASMLLWCHREKTAATSLRLSQQNHSPELCGTSCVSRQKNFAHAQKNRRHSAACLYVTLETFRCRLSWKQPRTWTNRGSYCSLLIAINSMVNVTNSCVTTKRGGQTNRKEGKNDQCYKQYERV